MYFVLHSSFKSFLIERFSIYDSGIFHGSDSRLDEWRGQ